MSPSDQLLKDLQAATQDLHGVNPWLGLLRLGGLGVGLGGLVKLAWQSTSPLGFTAWALAAGLVYAFCLICTHDATHQTLTGWGWLDQALARLISWPMLWPFGTYSHLHQLHHSWNSRDLRDPERVQWTLAEYQQASAWQRWYLRHQLVIDVMVGGGLGLIGKTTAKGLELRGRYPRLTYQLWLDGAGMALMQGGLLAWILLTHQSLAQYLLFWLLLERTIGGLIQARGHLEHYGLWRCASPHQLNQLYTGRNQRVLPGLGWLLGGLQYHAVHHAFPGIPWTQLETAFHRIQGVLAQHQWAPMELEDGYVSSLRCLAQAPSLIDQSAQPEHLSLAQSQRVVAAATINGQDWTARTGTIGE